MNRRAYYFDIAERAAKTFAQGFAISWLASNWVPGMSFTDVLTMAALMGVSSVMTSIASGKIGNPGTASSLPKSLEPQPPQFGARR